MNTIYVKQLFIHPVKGLSPQSCDKITLKAGHGIPGDRAFALMYCEGENNILTSNVPWMQKHNFAMQNDWHKLAALDCFYDESTSTLIVKREGVELLVADTNNNRDLISTFFSGYLAGITPSKFAKHSNYAPLQFVGDGKNTRYPDREVVHISLVSQATIDHMTELAGKYVDVRRFRSNIVLDHVPAWQEFNWVGQKMQLGTVEIEITARINRCLNIEVNPETGEKDLPLLSLLKKNFQHTQTGVLAKVITNGSVKIGDEIFSVSIV